MAGRRLRNDDRHPRRWHNWTATFDELFELGMERDNDLWLRGHVGTRDGRKGARLSEHTTSRSTARSKNIYGNGLITGETRPFSRLWQN